MNKYLLGGIILGALYLVYRKEQQSAVELVDSIQFNPSNLSIDTTHLLSPKVILNFEVNNPTPTPVEITKIFGTIKSGSSPDILATINNNQVINIATQGVTNLPVQINLNAIQIGEDIYSGKLDGSFTIEGYAMCGLIQVPFKNVLQWPL